MVTPLAGATEKELRISIHTTASVVTVDTHYLKWLRKISIHTTASVVTLEDKDNTPEDKFQSTPLHQW